MLVERVLVDDKAVSFDSAVRIAAGASKVEIPYTAIRLRSPEGLRFKYWMNGFDPGWTEAGERRVAYFTNLHPGEYRFHVVAYGAHDPAGASERILRIHWLPRFYQTSWFLALCTLAAAAAIWGGYRLHARGVQQRFEAVLEERNRLAREMHDTLIQGCTGVSAVLEAASSAAEVAPPVSRQLLERARREARSMVEEARLAVWGLRQGEGGDLAEAVARLTERIGDESGIPVRFEKSGVGLPLGAEAQRSLLLLIREALQNGVRHASATSLAVRLRFERRALEVSVEDDGRGFDCSPSALDPTRHYGLMGMRERVQKLGGEFDLTSAPGQGTSVGVRIPSRGAVRPSA